MSIISQECHILFYNSKYILSNASLTEQEDTALLPLRCMNIKKWYVAVVRNLLRLSKVMQWLGKLKSPKIKKLKIPSLQSQASDGAFCIILPVSQKFGCQFSGCCLKTIATMRTIAGSRCVVFVVSKNILHDGAAKLSRVVISFKCKTFDWYLDNYLYLENCRAVITMCITNKTVLADMLQAVSTTPPTVYMYWP